MHATTRRSRSPLILLALALAVAVGACEGITTVDPATTHIDLNGLWEGTTSGSRLEMTLRHDTIVDEVRGFGAIVPTGPGTSRGFRVDGFVDDDLDIVTLLLEVSAPTLNGEDGVTLIYYRARPFGSQRLEGRLNGGTFNDANLALQRARVVGANGP